MEAFEIYFKTAELDNVGVLQHTQDRAEINGSIVASFLLGCMFGSMIVSILADSIGRKRSIVLGSFLFTIGGLIQCLAQVVWHLYLGRAIGGKNKKFFFFFFFFFY